MVRRPRRRTGLSIALQTALGALSGAAGGYAQQEELKRKREIEGAEAEERRALNLANLYKGGFRTAEQIAQQEEKAALAGARLLSSIKGSGRVSDQDVSELSRVAAAQGREPRQITYGGQRLTLPETEAEREERVAGLEAERKLIQQRQQDDARIRALTDVLNRPEFSSIAPGTKSAILAGASGVQGMPTLESVIREQRDRELTPYQKAQLDIDKRRLAIQENAARTRATEAEWRQTRLPAAANAKLAGYESGVLMVADVRNQLEGNPDAVGLKNMLWSQITNRVDPTGAGVRASIEALSGEIRNQRFGGALTTGEAKFAERFLPNATDRADVAMTKLKQLENYLEMKRKGIYSVYGGQYNSLTGGSAADQLRAAAGR